MIMGVKTIINYEDVYHMLELPRIAIELGTGKVKHPSPLVTAPFWCDGFPPALVPLWDTGSAYKGYWVHWFTSRVPTIVLYYLEEGRAYEIARDINQLLCYEANYLYDPDDLLQFARDVGLDALQLDAITSLTSDDPVGLKALPAFRENSPLKCHPNGTGYEGDFPNGAMTFTEETVRRACTLEVGAELKERIAALPYAPPWFKTTNQAKVFYDLVDQGDLAGAWMCLNSSGWAYTDAQKAIARLSEKSGDRNFAILAEAWIAQPLEDLGSY
jgi:hypothetical protein